MADIRVRPVAGYSYSLRHIYDILDLLDSPCLCVVGDNPIQTAHLTDEQLFSVPGMAESRWMYKFTTHEWIPVFTYLSSNPPASELLDIIPCKDPRDGLWITPKGFPRSPE